MCVICSTFVMIMKPCISVANGELCNSDGAARTVHGATGDTHRGARAPRQRRQLHQSRTTTHRRASSEHVGRVIENDERV